MILDPDRSSGRGRALAAVCLALLAGTVAAAGAARPTQAAAPPAQAHAGGSRDGREAG